VIPPDLSVFKPAVLGGFFFGRLPTNTCSGRVKAGFVFRVVTKRRDHLDKLIIEHGPWLQSEDDANGWAMILRKLGYVVQVENMRGEVSVFA
jgi:hypothetical protein